MRAVWVGGVTLLALLLTASLGAFAQDEVVELKVGVVGDLNMWIDELIPDFHARNPNIRISMVDNTGWNMEKVISAHLAGDPFDVVVAVIEQASAIVDLGLLQPLDSFMERDTDPEFAEFMADVDSTIMNIFNYNGSQYYLPFEWNQMMMYYNPRLYEEAGLAAPTSDWTWQDFLQNARALTRDVSGDGQPDVYGYGQFFWNPFGFSPWILTSGGRILDESWSESTMNDPAVYEAVDFVRSLIWDHNVLPGPAISGNYTALDETIAMWGAGRWPAAGYQNAGFENYDVQLWPRHRDQRTVWGGGAHGISSVTAHPEEAWEFVKWVNSFFVVDHVTRLGTSMPSRRSVALSDAISDPPNRHLYYEALNGIVTVPAPPEYPDLHTVFEGELRKVWDGEASPGSAVEEIHRQFNLILSGD